ncbi:hypothetical protein ACJX0J_035001, partial [Zea mays]
MINWMLAHMSTELSYMINLTRNLCFTGVENILVATNGAQENNILTGLCTHLIPHGLIILQYARNLKMILYIYELIDTFGDKKKYHLMNWKKPSLDNCIHKMFSVRSIFYPHIEIVDHLFFTSRIAKCLDTTYCIMWLKNILKLFV